MQILIFICDYIFHLMTEADDSSCLYSLLPCVFQGSESENESERSDPHSFVNHYANVNDSLRQSWKRQKPVRNYSSYTDSEPEGSAVMSLNGGQIIMNNMARSRAPLPGFSSFV
jgi:protein sidekick